jgi:hypothetical protein
MHLKNIREYDLTFRWNLKEVELRTESRKLVFRFWRIEENGDMLAKET